MDDRLPVCPSSGRSEEHTSELQSLALPDVLPIYHTNRRSLADHARIVGSPEGMDAPISSWTIDFRFARHPADRKSTRLNSSHLPYQTFFRSITQIGVALPITPGLSAVRKEWPRRSPHGRSTSGLPVIRQIGRAHV